MYEIRLAGKIRLMPRVITITMIMNPGMRTTGKAGTTMKTTGIGSTGCSLRMTTIGRMTAGTNGEAISPGQSLETAGQIA